MIRVFPEKSQEFNRLLSRHSVFSRPYKVKIGLHPGFIRDLAIDCGFWPGLEKPVK
jgi:hypothetical protein